MNKRIKKKQESLYHKRIMKILHRQEIVKRKDKGYCVIMTFDKNRTHLVNVQVFKDIYPVAMH